MKSFFFFLAVALVAGCGPAKHPYVDAGPEDAGVDSGVADAGRVRGLEPPTGYTTALELPPNLPPTAVMRVGVCASMALDQFGQPMVAAIHVDPNNTGVRVADQLVFTRWNGVDKKYQLPVPVALIGQIDISEPNRQVSLTRDPSTGTIGVAFLTDQNIVRIAVSDDEGANWSLETASLPNASGHVLSNPALVLRDGVAHLAYFEAQAQCASTGCGQIVYRRRAGKALFADVFSPVAAGSEVTLARPIALAVDALGQAGLAYFSGPPAAGATVRVLFWRPAGAVTTQVLDTGGAPIPKPISVSLTFEGELPRLAFHLPSASQSTAQLWYAPAADPAGTTFAPVAIPRNSAGAPDGGVVREGTQSYQAVAIDSAGKAAVAGDYEQNQAQQQCTGGPKLARSAASGTGFDVCRPDVGGTGIPTFGFAGEWINAAFHQTGKVTLAFTYENASIPPPIKAGVIIFREP